MIENTYLVWDVKADSALIRVIAWTEDQALGKAESIVPNRSKYEVSQVGEYWLPGVNLEGMTKVFERTFEKLNPSVG